MSNQIVPFEFGGEQIRPATLDGKPALVLSDIARILGYRDAANASRILRDHHKGYSEVSTPSGVQQMLVVTEQGFNRLVIRSNAANAEQVQDFITDEVMPQLSRTGSYARPLTLAERSLALLSELSEEVQRQAAEIVELKPLASQARTFNKRKGNTGKQAFARDVIGMALDMGAKVTANQVYEFMGVQLDMFIHGVGLRSHGHASMNGKRRGLSDTDKGTHKITGHKYEQGMLTPKGVEYAWARIETYVREHGHLELPKKEIAA